MWGRGEGGDPRLLTPSQREGIEQTIQVLEKVSATL